MSSLDFLSPFEELVLTALQECGNGAPDKHIWLKVRELASRGWIPFNRVQATLQLLELDGCVYSWGNQVHRQHKCPVLRQYRMQFRGERALVAAVQSRSGPAVDYFYRASRFGMLWDAWSAFRCRVGCRAWGGDISGVDENLEDRRL